jgi:hypothetical protein
MTDGPTCYTIPIHSLLRDGGSEVGMPDLTQPAQYAE